MVFIELDHQLRARTAEMDMTRADIIREALREKMARLESGARELSNCTTPAILQDQDEDGLTAMWMDREITTGYSNTSAA